MQNFKRQFLAATVAAVAAIAFSGAAFAQVQERTIKFAMQNTAGSAQYDAAIKFADIVKAKSQGKIKVNVFGGGALGKDTAVVSAMQGGTVDMCVMNSSLLAGVAKQMAVYDFPFVFANEQEAYSVVDGAFGKKLHALLEPKGLVGLSYWELGFRHFHNSKRPIAKFEDLQGLKIRVIETPIYVDFMRARRWASPRRSSSTARRCRRASPARPATFRRSTCCRSPASTSTTSFAARSSC